MADEPRAALAGRDILSGGGTAADAVSAMYFTLAVTLPSRAGLGGGGMCLAFDAETGAAEALDFTAPGPSVIPPGSDRPSAVPANPRGFAALQARHGVLQWREVIAPAEQLARFGHPASRAFAADLQTVGPALLADTGARAIYTGKSGQAVGEGEVIKQVDLAATLGLLRGRGVGPFYSGPFAQTLVEAVKSAGGSLTLEDLRGYTPTLRKTVRVEIGNEVAHFAPPPAAASSVAALMLAMLEENGGFDTANEGGRAQLMAEIGLRTFADRETWLDTAGNATKDPAGLVTSERLGVLMKGMERERRTPVSAFVPKPRNRNETPSATAFAAVDSWGNAVSCAVTMNAAFGTGRVAGSTGVLLAAAPDVTGRGPLGLAPMLVVNENSKEFRLAAAASGGVAAPSALANVAARLLLAGQNVRAALAAPRVHLSGDPDITYFEQGLDAAAADMLTQAGHRTAATPAIGTVHALFCPEGLPTTPESCQMGADPRSSGLATGSMR